MTDIADQSIRYRLVVVISGKSRELPRTYKDWNKCAEHGEKMRQKGRISGFRIVVKN